MGWWSPLARGVLPLDGLRVTRSLRKMRPRYEMRVDTAFDAVLAGCGDPQRPNGWIDDDIAGSTATCTPRDRAQRGGLEPAMSWPAGCTG